MELHLLRWVDLLMFALNRKITAAVALPIAGVISALAFSQSGASRADAQTTPVTNAEAQVVQQDKLQYSTLSPPRSVDDVSSWRLFEPGDFGQRPTEAKIIERTNTRTLAIVPTNDIPCLAYRYADGSSGIGCAGSTRVVAAVSYTGSIGIVSDSVQTVHYTLTDGRKVTGAVEDNLWKAPLEAELVSFTENGQVREVHLMPASSEPADSRLSSDGSSVIVGSPSEDSGQD